MLDSRPARDGLDLDQQARLLPQDLLLTQDHLQQTRLLVEPRREGPRASAAPDGR